MAKNPRDIPAAIACQVRRRCGFGCVICGCPVYDIHHIQPWAEVHEHKPENLTLLCGSHHAQKSKGLISCDRVREFNKSPMNLQKGETSRYPLLFEGDSCNILIGNNLFMNHSQTSFFSAIMIDNVSILGFAFVEHRLLLSVSLYDEYNRPVLLVTEGWLTAVTTPWDITFIGDTLTIRDAPRKIRLEISFQPPCTLRVRRGMFLCNGVALAVSEHGVECLNTGQVLANCDFVSNGFGLGFGCIPDSFPGCWGNREVRRYSESLSLTHMPKSPQSWLEALRPTESSAGIPPAPTPPDSSVK